MRALWMVPCVMGAMACVATETRALRLPPPTESLETRVVAYQELAGMPHRNWSGWRMRTGNGEVGDVNDARAVMQNDPEARRIFEEYDSTRRLGFGLLAGGIAAILVSPVVLLTTAVDRSSGSRPDSAAYTGFSLLMLGGLVASTVGSVIVGGTEHYVPEATEAYNRWLWRQLALPTRAAAVAPEVLDPGVGPTTTTTPAPATGLTTTSPW